MNKEIEGRNIVQPIRSKKDIEDCFTYLKRQIEAVHESQPFQKKIATRNLMMVYLGINVGLRISDLLRIKVKHIQDGMIVLREMKTKKIQQIPLNKSVEKTIQNDYIKKFNLDSDSYLFISRKGFNRSISRQNADVILKKIAEALKWKFAFSTHSLRKTFGYQYYKETNNVVALQQMLNHAKPKETLIYIGIMKEEVDKERKDFSIDMDL